MKTPSRVRPVSSSVSGSTSRTYHRQVSSRPRSVPATMLSMPPPLDGPRSEEHTSELQSRRDLVCRLLHDTATTELYPLSLHDALPTSRTYHRQVSSRPRSVPATMLSMPPPLDGP